MRQRQIIQIVGNSIVALFALISFSVIANYLRLSGNSCSGLSYCTAYKSFQANCAFSFFWIFVPFCGMFSALRAKKQFLYSYYALSGVILFVIVVTCAVVFGNSEARSNWELFKAAPSEILTSEIKAFVASYNMCIAQIVLIWFLQGGSATVTYLAFKEEVGNQPKPVQQAQQQWRPQDPGMQPMQVRNF